MKEFQFLEELRSWVQSVNPIGEVWVRWTTRIFRIYIRAGLYVASDVTSGARRVVGWVHE